MGVCEVPSCRHHRAPAADGKVPGTELELEPQAILCSNLVAQYMDFLGLELTQLVRNYPH